MTEQERREEIAAFLAAQDADVVAVGPLSRYDREFVGLDGSVKERYTFAVSFGFVLSKGITDTLRGGPHPLYLHHYRQVNNRLDMTAYLLAKTMEQRGYHALPFAASQLVDWQNQKGHLSHKHMGVIAGAGWIGRNNLLIHPRFGAQVRYTTVLTDMPLAADSLCGDSCGECRACIEVCPAGAIKESPGDFDHKACFETLRKFRNERNLGHYICGICVAACGGTR
jgi:epoxyqueuosine reductase